MITRVISGHFFSPASSSSRVQPPGASRALQDLRLPAVFPAVFSLVQGPASACLCSPRAVPPLPASLLGYLMTHRLLHDPQGPSRPGPWMFEPLRAVTSIAVYLLVLHGQGPPLHCGLVASPSYKRLSPSYKIRPIYRLQRLSAPCNCYPLE